MDLFPGTQLHARQCQQAVALRRPAEGGAVTGGVVVGEGDHVQAGQGAHGGQVGGGHVVAPAGRKAGVQMQVIVEFQGRTPPESQTGVAR